VDDDDDAARDFQINMIHVGMSIILEIVKIRVRKLLIKKRGVIIQKLLKWVDYNCFF